MLQDIPTPTLREASPCVLETERLTLRKPTLADVKAIARLANDRRIAREYPSPAASLYRRTMPLSSSAPSRTTAARPCS